MFRAIDKWLAGYVRSAFHRPRNVSGPMHLMFCVADHFEPFRGNAPKHKAEELVDRWVRDLPVLAGKYSDSDGRQPQHTFFYPQEEYDFECVEKLAGLCRSGAGEVEIHLHHRNDTEQGLQTKLENFRDTLRNKHGLLGADSEGRTRYGFIHGNWALCNSRPDGDWCGVNSEIGILRNTGCYADFTFPSAPSPTQPRMVNEIYYASDTGGPGACDMGEIVSSFRSQVSGLKFSASGGQVSLAELGQAGKFHPSSLLLVTGPLALDWRRRKWGIFPRLDNGAVTAVNPFLPGRIDLWVSRHIHVDGRPDWIFVKVYVHGCLQDDIDCLLGAPMLEGHNHLAGAYNDGKKWSLHYVTAREMYNIVKAAEAGKSGNPGEYRDFEVSKPPCAG